MSLSLGTGLHLMENLEEICLVVSNPKGLWISISEHLRCSGNEPEPRDNLAALLGYEYHLPNSGKRKGFQSP